MLVLLSGWFYALGRPWPIPPLGLGCSSREFYSSLDSNCAPWHRPVIVMRSGISLPFCDCKSAVKGGLGESLFRLLRLPRFPSSCYPTTFPMFYDFKVHCYCRLSFVSQLATYRAPYHYWYDALEGLPPKYPTHSTQCP